MFGNWRNSFKASSTINENLSEFYKYAEYPSPEYIATVEVDEQYDMMYDPFNPLYFAPPDCMKKNSF